MTPFAEEPLRKRCAWCLRPLDGRGPLRQGDAVSHGICRACVAREEKRYLLLLQARAREAATLGR